MAEGGKVTYQEYAQMTDEHRYEVLEGELVMVPAPNYRHQRMLLAISRTLGDLVEKQVLGEVNIAPLDIILADDVVVQPDVILILAEHRGIIVPEGVRGAPDLVVEVLSPGTAHRDRGIKQHLYGAHGVAEYWIVDPEGLTIEVHINRDGRMESVGLYGLGDRVESHLLAGHDLPVERLLGQPRP